MNKELYGNKIPLPEDVVGYLDDCFSAAEGADENTEGFRRNKELRDGKEITYQQLKRMKNFFDNFDGHENDLPYILSLVPVPNKAKYIPNIIELFPAPLGPDSKVTPCSPKSKVEFS